MVDGGIAVIAATEVLSCHIEADPLGRPIFLRASFLPFGTERAKKMRINQDLTQRVFGRYLSISSLHRSQFSTVLLLGLVQGPLTNRR
jgi:hypothetical protein